MENEFRALECIIRSMWYNRETKDIINILREIADRLNHNHTICSDDGDIIYGMLVLLYGNYGTSPRSGWIYDPIYSELKKEIQKLIKEYQNTLRLEDTY